MAKVPKTVLYDNLKSVVIQKDKYGKNRHGLNDNFLDFSKGLFIPKLCKPYRAKTKGKVERFNLYLKNNFYKPLRAKLKNTPIQITSELLNSYIFSWLEKANNRVHATTNQRPFDMLQQEYKFLTKAQIHKDEKNEKETQSEKTFIKIKEYPDFDISYYTNLNEYEKLLLSQENL